MSLYYFAEGLLEVGTGVRAVAILYTNASANLSTPYGDIGAGGRHLYSSTARRVAKPSSRARFGFSPPT